MMTRSTEPLQRWCTNAVSAASITTVGTNMSVAYLTAAPTAMTSAATMQTRMLELSSGHG